MILFIIRLESFQRYINKLQISYVTKQYKVLLLLWNVELIKTNHTRWFSQLDIFTKFQGMNILKASEKYRRKISQGILKDHTVKMPPRSTILSQKKHLITKKPPGGFQKNSSDRVCQFTREKQFFSFSASLFYI